MGVLESYLWRVEDVFLTTKSGTVDLSKDPTFAYKDYIAIRKQPVFWFREGFALFYMSQPITNTQFADSVETVYISRKIAYPTDLHYVWDEAKKNIVIYTDSSEFSNLKIPLMKTALPDKASIRVYTTIEEAGAAQAHENLTIVAEENDPVIGKMTYTFNLKPLWQYGRAGDLNQTFYYAVF